MYLLDALGVLSLKLYFLDLLVPVSSYIVSWTSQTVPWPLKVYFLDLLVCPYSFYLLGVNIFGRLTERHSPIAAGHL